MAEKKAPKRSQAPGVMGTSIRDADRDLGFGDKVSRETRMRFLNRDGSFNVERRGLRNLSFINLYHILLTMRWSRFLLLVLLLYFVSNIVFGIVYAMFGSAALVDTSQEPMTNIMLRGFFFSVQTFATIGYGTIHPVGVLPNLVVTIESYYSLLANALITGLVFARFSRPEAKIIFSENAIVAPYRDGKGLMIRLVNNRKNMLIELRAQVMYARFEDEGGRLVRRFDSLNLERDRVSFLPLSWTIVHPIDEDSPLFGASDATLREKDAEFIVLISGLDETFAQSVHSRTSYKTDEIRFGYRFSNIYNPTEPGEPITIDVRRLSEIETAES